MENQAHAGNQPYDSKFFKEQQGAMQMAGVILPVVEKYVHPKSVVDIGCGIGSWIAMWKKLFGAKVCGIDGDYVDHTQLLIDEEEFYPANLEGGWTESLDKKFDLVESLEVAEHLSPSRADSFVEDLTKLGDVILFSAAIVGQGGTNHVNEQMQSYWAKKFLRLGYVGVDCIRPKVWDSAYLPPWRKQNTIIYVDSKKLYHYPELQKYYLDHGENVIYDLVHPDLWINRFIQFQNMAQNFQAYIEKLNQK